MSSGTENGPANLQRTLQTTGLVIAPVTVLAALASYIGWVRTRAHASYLGFDATIVPLSTSDYVLRSVGPMFRPVVALLLAVVASVWLHWFLLTLSARRGAVWIRGPAGVLIGLGIAALVLTVASPLWSREGPGWFKPLREAGDVSLRPVAFMVAVAAFAYGVYLLRLITDRRRAVPAWLDITSLVVVVLIFVGGLFWGMGNYAYARGLQSAEEMAGEGFKQLATVVVYSEQDLLLDAPGVHTADVWVPGARYRYRTTGLRLLISYEDRFVLLPDGWSRQERVVVLLDRDGQIRFEFR